MIKAELPNNIYM